MQNNFQNKTDNNQHIDNAPNKKNMIQPAKNNYPDQLAQGKDQQQSQQKQQPKQSEPEAKKYNYQIEKVIGQGTFGCVYLAMCLEMKEKVAIKKVFQDKRFKNRELQIIMDLNHCNIVKLIHAFFSPAENSKDEMNLNLVMEYIPDTLSKVIRQYRKTKQQFPPHLVKVYAYQMFRGLAYLLGIDICHRDIKPQNLLINNDSMVLKICDFGSAKKLSKVDPNVSYICSRYYRAPELIFGAQWYTNAIDVWSMGCVIAEMVTGEPLFPGESAVDQLVEIIKILGTPTLDQVNMMNPDHTEFKFPQIKALPWNKVFQKYKIEPLLIDLLSKLLVYSPAQRPKPLEVLQHPYFNELRTEQFHQQYPNCPDLFNFTPEEQSTNPEIVKNLVPPWYEHQKMDGSSKLPASIQEKSSSQALNNIPCATNNSSNNTNNALLNSSGKKSQPKQQAQNHPQGQSKSQPPVIDTSHNNNSNKKMDQ